MSVLKFDRNQYRYGHLDTIPEEDRRSEYSRLRKIANNRIDALSKRPDLQLPDARLDKFPTLKQLDAEGTPNAVEYGLSELADYVSSKTTIRDLTKVRSNTINALKARGIKGVNKDNWTSWVSFLKEHKDKGDYKYNQAINNVLDYSEAFRIPASEIMKNYDKWVQNQEVVAQRMKEIDDLVFQREALLHSINPRTNQAYTKDARAYRRLSSQIKKLRDFKI